MPRYSKKITVISLLLITGVFLGIWFYLSIYDYGTWSISIYQGPSIFNLKPHDKIKKHPILSAANVTDVDAKGVADPFMIRYRDRWFLFFEVIDKKLHKGRIGLATSQEGTAWNYEKIVIDENFHLSYPYVFQWGKKIYLIPESKAAGAIRLYTATEFPYKWKHECDIIKGMFQDPSICFKDNKFWLFTLNDKDQLVLFFADSLIGPWMEHPKSPLISNDMNISRPGGRLLILEDKLIRFAQDCDPDYGNSVRVFEIDLLSTTEYAEHELTNSPLLAGTGSGWNRDGMHHVDLLQISNNDWIASVDGKKYEREFSLIHGIKKGKRIIKSLWKNAY